MHRSLMASLALCLSTLLLLGSGQERFAWDLPDWMPQPKVPADNPMTYAKVELGRHLFYDKRLSADQSMSCASCHMQTKAFTDGLAVSQGVTKERGTRSAMSLANAAYIPALTWANPSLTSLEVQALIPIFGQHPVEMGMAGKEKELLARLQREPQYQRLFASAFPHEAARGTQQLYSVTNITRALASFQRTLLSFDSAYDRYTYGKQKDAMSPSALRGENLFFSQKFECYQCHGGPTFTDNITHSKLPLPERVFHNTGLYNMDGRGAYPKDNRGIREITADSKDEGKFRTPSLRNIALTAPYMHDGSIPTLDQVIREHYAKAGMAAKSTHGASPTRSSLIAGFEVSDEEVNDLVAFMQSLTDHRFVTNPKHADPWLQR